MPPVPVVQLTAPLKAVSIVPNGSHTTAGTHSPVQPLPFAQPNGVDCPEAAMPERHTQNQVYHQACQAFQDAAARLNALADDLVAGHSEAIARLSVEIARKVLMRNIADGDYEIEAIIREALKNAPEKSPVAVYLSPQDVAVYRQSAGADQSLAGIELREDAALGPAECIVDSPKGIIRLLIDEHLEQIGKALIKTG